MKQIDCQGVGLTSPRARHRMVALLARQGIQDARVLAAMDAIPRHWFVDEALAHRAYSDSALPIGLGQTISQPYIVARMTEVILTSGITPRRVLEIGTGSGYQTAVLSALVAHVATIERIASLQNRAKQRLQRLGVENVEFRHADGHVGWPQSTDTFDAILSAAAAEQLPEALLQQLSPNGVLIAPLGSDQQFLYKIQRLGDSHEFRREQLDPVRFVPMLSGLRG